MVSTVIDLDKIKAIAHRGIHRAVFFMGFGINAAMDPSLTRYHLADEASVKDTGIVLHMLPLMDASAVETGKKNFSTWIVGCGLRELIETFAIFLDNVHKACLLAAWHNRTLDGDGDKLQKKFHHGGLEDKLDHLSNRFGVVSKYPQGLKSIARARNCLTHRAGVVAAKDVTHDDVVVVEWMAMKITIKMPDGTIQPFRPNMYAPAGHIMLREYTQSEARFSVGQKLDLTPQQLLEICWFVSNSADEFIVSTIDYLQRHGISVSKATAGE